MANFKIYKFPVEIILDESDEEYFRECFARFREYHVDCSWSFEKFLESLLVSGCLFDIREKAAFYLEH